MAKRLRPFTRERGTLNSVVTGTFVVFAFLVVFITITIYVTVGVAINRAQDQKGPYKLIRQKENLVRERYNRLAVSAGLGSGGYIEVLDANANVIYCSNLFKNNTYDKEEIEYIQSIDGGSYYSADVVYVGDEVAGYVIHKYSLATTTIDNRTGEVVAMGGGVSGVMILDSNKNVTYSTMDNGVTHISDTEFEYMYGGSEPNTVLQKYEFVTAKGQKRTLLLHANYSNANLRAEYKRILIIASSTFALCLLILILVFVFRISFTIRRPLKLLESAMLDITRGKTDTTVAYEGPREFVEIADAFNMMSTELHDSEKKRAAAEQEKQKMLADISHDLKTPITVIQGYAKAVADGLIPKEDEKKYLDTISKKADGLSELINTFYEYSKLEHPEFQLVRETGDVAEYFREYLALKYEELELVGFNIEPDIPDERIMYSFDKMQLKRVFENIISNSIKANKEGTTIIASMKKAGDKIIIRLGDDGVGIPKNLRKDVFKPFVVGNESRTSGQGTGLGLSIAYLVVKAHGGTIRLLDEAEAEGKTIFEIVL
ncbi:HAMP domain-containing histidine kinase [Butyrivibrio sp. DSM 10294]|uniref:HAMP domain-containing sensor histidine kinase n=1 Tax=Butyrivibrio sp. DSM 10294 TaxID=2972457 RepID=UPI00234E9BED|nr:HAMP domain-containing sensor histidine kinase [Butyrivibrio sp. DSM 10294]MDC7294240.1 HAMP domain-containing histidine kinase [Butyrivibrio sp. DSM 10294]